MYTKQISYSNLLDDLEKKFREPVKETIFGTGVWTIPQQLKVIMPTNNASKEVT